MNAKFNPNLKNKNFEVTPLNLAMVHNANIKILQMLVDSGADVNSSFSSDELPPILTAIIKCRNVMYLKFLVKNGVNVNSTNKDGIYPLLAAILYNVGIEILVEAGANINFLTLPFLDLSYLTTCSDITF